MITKEEVYKKLIDIQKKAGQGLAGIVRAMGIDSHKIGEYLDELIEEGLVICMETGGSLGDPESNRFYMPTKGYNVWADDGTDGQYFRHKGRYLHFVRLYLGILSNDVRDKDDQKNFIDPTNIFYLRNHEIMKSYSEWLDRNHKELDEMLNLDDFYETPIITFSDDEISWIKKREWYQENKTITDCSEDEEKNSVKNAKIKSITKELIGLYSSSDQYNKDRLEAEESMIEIDRSTYNRKKLNKFFETLDKTTKIQEVI